MVLYIIPIEKLIIAVSNGYYRVKNISLLKRQYMKVLKIGI